MLLLDILMGVAGVFILAPVLILSTEVLLALSSNEDGTAATGMRPRLAVLIPAHDEALGIRDTVRSLVPQLQNRDRLLVVADNCSDSTAAIASAAGAEVIVRTHHTERGKGYALDFGVHHLEHDPPDVVLIVDADCHVVEGSVDVLARACALTGRPVQALNLSCAPPGANLTMRIAEFASTLKNRIRPLGLRRLGLPCQLTGTGMALPWSCIISATLATGHIVEDLTLGLELARAGYPPVYSPQARVTSYFPASQEGFKSQRTRWEHGHLGVLLKDAAPLILQSLYVRNWKLLALGLDLAVPPLALLSLVVSCAWLLGAVLYVVIGVELLFLTATLAAVLLALSVLASWARFGRRILSLGSLAFGIVYALRKVPLYVRFLARRQLSWVRTRRDKDRPV